MCSSFVSSFKYLMGMVSLGIGVQTNTTIRFGIDVRGYGLSSQLNIAACLYNTTFPWIHIVPSTSQIKAPASRDGRLHCLCIKISQVLESPLNRDHDLKQFSSISTALSINNWIRLYYSVGHREKSLKLEMKVFSWVQNTVCTLISHIQ